MADRDKDHLDDHTIRLSLERRDFFKLVGGGIFVFFTAGEVRHLVAQERRGMYPTDLNAYLRIAEDGKVSIFSGKIEMGQGVMTSLAQMAADELGVPLQAIEMIMGDTDVCVPDMGTFGSMSTRFFGPPLRTAAAEAKSILLDLASEQLKAPKDKLTVENGAVFVTSDKKARVTFGRLAKGQQLVRKVDGKVELKSISQFSLMGKSIKRLDGSQKVTGKAAYAGDIRFPDMLYAKVLRPPAHRAVLKSVDTSTAEKTPGVTVVNQDGIVAVLHKDPEAAEKAVQSIRADFQIPDEAVDNQTIFDHLVKAAPQPREMEKKGDLAEGEKLSASIFEGKYVNGYGAHAPMETHTALAKFEGGKMTVWAATQTPFPNQQQVAQALGLQPQNVRIITPFVGGGFGGKASAGVQSVEAAKLAKITGKPVQVTFSRAEEFFYDTFRPAAVVRVKSGTDANGKISLWDYHVYFAGSRSAEQFYDVPHNLMRVYGQWSGSTGNAHPFGVGAWRAPGANINVFARESQIDIMAAKAKVDPLEFRLNNTSDTRMRSVLKAAAERYGWKKAVGPSGRGVGIACGIDAETYVAIIAEVKVDKTAGRVKVTRLVCAQEMGTVINPEGALMQAEGCMMMGLGYTLSEDVFFKGGDIKTKSFGDYELPRFSWLPDMEVLLVKNDELPPKGGGEPAIVPMGAVVANAIFDATGARLFQMPLTPERIMEALRKV